MKLFENAFTNVSASAMVLTLAVLTGALDCGTQNNRDRVSPETDTLSLRAEFLYLPDENRMIATVTPESTVIERRDSRDRVVETVRKVNTPEARSHYDSAVQAMRTLKPGTYRRDHVIDGTRIRLHHRGHEVFCDNCLHDFVLETAGAIPNRPPAGAEIIRRVVRHVSSMVMIAEGKKAPGMRLLSVTLSKSHSGDTAARYQVHTPNAGHPSQAPGKEEHP